ncbi:MAG: hypothetical protein U1G08_08690 [Verrucomicrobiota bacterium]
MSAIASFIKLSKSALDGLREAAIPKKRFFGAPRDSFHDYLRKHGAKVAEYPWSGYVLATLLPYLQEQHQIDLMRSEQDALSKYLSENRSVTVFIFTSHHRTAYADKLGAEFSEQALRDYYNEFNGSSEPDVGKPMLDGIRAIRQSLNALDESSVIIIIIG